MHLQVQLREGDLSWPDFEARASKTDGFTPHAADVNEITNILFSSGTTGEIFISSGRGKSLTPDVLMRPLLDA